MSLLLRALYSHDESFQIGSRLSDSVGDRLAPDSRRMLRRVRPRPPPMLPLLRAAQGQKQTNPATPAPTAAYRLDLGFGLLARRMASAI